MEGKLTTTFSTESLHKPFTYIFTDPKWKSKFLIYLGITLAAMFIPVLPGLIVLGYGYQIMHRVIVGDGEPVLPEWSDWGKMFADGWRLFCVNFLYLLPMTILQIIPLILYFGFIFTIPFMAESNNEPILVVIFFIIMIFFILSIGLIAILWILYALILPPAMCRTVEQESFKAGFEIREWWKVLRANFGGYLLALLLLIGFYSVLIFTFQIFYMTLVLWCLLPFILLFGSSYLSLVMYPLIALVYREGLDKIAGQVE